MSNEQKGFGVVRIGRKSHESGREVDNNMESKHEKFKRLATARANRILNNLRKLGNLSSPNYEYTDSEIEKIFSVIEKTTSETRGKFKKRNIDKGGYKLEL